MRYNGIARVLITCFILFPIVSWSKSTPIFVITPLVAAPTQATQGQTITAIYQIINNTNYNLSSIRIANLQTGITQVTTTESSYCNSNPFSLDANASCLLKIQINTSQTSTSLQWNPQICIGNKGNAYCSQAFPSDQVVMTISPVPPPQDCASNISNFNYELIQQFDHGPNIAGYGAFPYQLLLSSDLNTCAADTSWQQQRVLAAARFWVQQKINYCHHYMPDWLTPVAQRCSAYAPGGSTGGCCSFEPNLDPTSPLFNKIVRWNYNGQNSETLQYWQTYTRMWYGMDCTNYTRLLYNFAFGTFFTGDTPSQAGQNPNGSQANLSPNQQTLGNQLNYSCAPGALVCGDGTMDTGNLCVGHGGQFAANGLGNYFSIIDQSGNSQSNNSTIVSMIQSQLSLLQPGDLVYIAGDLDTGQPSSAVTHAVMWTGQVVGYGANNILPSQVAPDQYCTAANHCNWQGIHNIGAYVITDSHYQGADYRVFTDFFYLKDLWGVRRIIGSSWVPGTNCNPTT